MTKSIFVALFMLLFSFGSNAEKFIMKCYETTLYQDKDIIPIKVEYPVELDFDNNTVKTYLKDKISTYTIKSNPIKGVIENVGVIAIYEDCIDSQNHKCSISITIPNSNSSSFTIKIDYGYCNIMMKLKSP